MADSDWTSGEEQECRSKPELLQGVAPVVRDMEDTSSFSNNGRKEQKRRPKPKDGTILICGVCGDRALGYNFDAISCESCKAFFRRNATKSKPLSCNFEGNCKLDPHTRKFCSACRLKKCFSIGMKKDWILDEDQLVKRRKRQQIRQLQQQSNTLGLDIQPCSSTSGDLTGDESLDSFPGNNPSNPIPPSHQRGAQLQYYEPTSSSSTHENYGIEQRHLPHPHGPTQPPHTQHPARRQERHRTPLYRDSNPMSPTSTTTLTPGPFPSRFQPHLPTDRLSPGSVPHSPLHPYTPLPDRPVVPKREYSSPEDLNYYSFPPTSSNGNSINSSCPPGAKRPYSPPDSYPIQIKVEYDQDEEENEDYKVPLNPYIDQSIKELKEKYDSIFEAAYTMDQVPKLKERPKSANQLFNMTDIFIKRLIRFAKNIPEFKSLSEQDQIHLLKGGIMEMFVLRSAMGFDAKSNAWKYKMQQAQAAAAAESNNSHSPIASTTKEETQSFSPSGQQIQSPGKDESEGKDQTGGGNNQTGGNKLPVAEGKVDTSVMETIGSSMMKQHIAFVKQIQQITCNDRIILMLLFIIELMSPDRPNLVDKRTVSQCQERHSMWLKSYLESLYTVAETKVLYPKLLVKLLDVRNLGAESCHIASHLDVSNLEPLLVEVFDLK